MTTTAERLLARLREAGLSLPDGARLERTYYPRWRLSQGAWSWRAVGPDAMPLGIGSSVPMTELVRARRWNIGPESYGEVSISVSVLEGDAVPGWNSGRDYDFTVGASYEFTPKTTDDS